MQYIEMVVKYNEYHNKQIRKRFYIVGREQLNTNKYELCHTEWNNKYSDDYDFYKAVECNGGLNYIAVRKPSYRIITDKAIIEMNVNDVIYIDKNEYGTNKKEMYVSDVQIGDFIEFEEYEPFQKIIDIIEY